MCNSVQENRRYCRCGDGGSQKGQSPIFNDSMCKVFCSEYLMEIYLNGKNKLIKITCKAKKAALIKLNMSPIKDEDDEVTSETPLKPENK